ncbi:MAG: hypothetical protein QG670_1550 [Thermoproteota archaeon]|nr:hypothetical protein [Thermoproteota archaeon]
MSERLLYSNLTVRENLSLPLVFKGVEKATRDEAVDKALYERRLTGVANKFPRYLSEDEEKPVLEINTRFWCDFPELESFLESLVNDKSFRTCLSLFQREMFLNVSKDLGNIVTDFEEKDYEGAIRLLEESVDRLALRMVFAPFIEFPSVRVLEVLLLVMRNYRDLFKYKDKVDGGVLVESWQRIKVDLESLADSFKELS